MLKKCISLWIVACLLLVAASDHHSNDSNTGAIGQAPELIAFNH